MSKPAFRFTHYDLKELRGGTVLEISLSVINNVRLMTAPNFQRFKEGLDYKYAGGVAKKAPVKVVVPDTAHWHLIVDMEGHNGLAESSVKMVNPPAKARKTA